MNRTITLAVVMASLAFSTDVSAAKPPWLQSWLNNLPGRWYQCHTEEPVFRAIRFQSPATTQRRHMQFLRWQRINPYFAFNGSTADRKFRCRQNGPHKWDGEHWFVQDITHLRPTSCMDPANGALCSANVVRICSVTHIRPPGSEPTKGPFGTTVGWRGCGVRWSAEYAAPLPLP